MIEKLHLESQVGKTGTSCLQHHSRAEQKTSKVAWGEGQMLLILTEILGPTSSGSK